MSKLSRDEQIAMINSSPMSSAEKKQKIAELGGDTNAPQASGPPPRGGG